MYFSLPPWGSRRPLGRDRSYLVNTKQLPQPRVMRRVVHAQRIARLAEHRASRLVCELVPLLRHAVVGRRRRDAAGPRDFPYVPPRTAMVGCGRVGLLAQKAALCWWSRRIGLCRLFSRNAFSTSARTSLARICI